MDTDRFYPIDGMQYPSVTTCLSLIRKAELERWRESVGTEIADQRAKEGADFGIRVHDWCANIARGSRLLPVDDTRQTVERYANWFDDMVKEVLGIECVVFSRKYRFAGRLDLKALLKGDRLPAVIDIKTQQYCAPKLWRLQTGGYRLADVEMGGKCGRRIALHLPRDQQPKAHDFADHERDQRVFLYVKELYEFMRGR